MSILIPAAVVGGLGLAFGLILGITAKVFEIKKDERIEKIAEALPGANCGGCGYAGCSAYAEAIVTGGAPLSQCGVGGAQAVKEISEIMGVKSEGFTRKTARVMCAGTKECAATKYEYSGIRDCIAANKVAEGQKLCIYGCLGFGSCVDACDYGALSITDGVAKVDSEKCKACGKCVVRCPKHLIKLVPYDKNYAVLCSNHDKGIIAKNVCKVSCIGCGICAKNCPSDAITIINSVAVIDYIKCADCGLCEEKCPRKAIKRK